MKHVAFWFLFCLVLAPVTAAAQVPDRSAPAVEPPTPIITRSQSSAQATRRELFQVLRELPPGVQRVIQLDPSLLDRADYLASYPQLGAFLAQYPEVGRDPAYFFGSPDSLDQSPLNTLADMFTSAAVLTGAMTFLLVIGSVLRQAVSYRRWLRRARMQVDVHTKILDRLQSNEDLMSYIQTPAGRHFLEFGSPAVESASEPVAAAPLARILWSVQAGVVLTALGLGLWFAQGAVPDEVRGPLSVLSIVVLSVGLGAVASAGASYLLSARLGVLPAPRPEARAHDA